MSSAPCIPLKHIAGINERALPEHTDPDQRFRYLDIGAVGRGELVAEPEEMRFEDAPSRARRLVRAGDTIVSTVRTYLRAVWPVPAETGDLVVSTGFAVLTPHEVDFRYFSWWVRSDAFIEEVVARSVGVSYPAINALELGELKVRVPEAPVQRAIADFLDTETARIDALMAKKQRLAEALQDRFAENVRRSVLLNATYRDPLQVSPSEESPHGVRPMRLSWIARFGSGTTPEAGADEYYGGDTPWVLTGDLTDGEVPATSRTVTSHALAEYSALKVHRAGSLVVAMYGATIGKLGILKIDAAVNQACCVIAPAGELDTEFLFFYLFGFRQELIERGRGSGQPNISQDILRSLRLAIPPLALQQEVRATLKRKRGHLSRTVETLDEQIALLREHRQALITAAVTGEVEVPGVAV